MPLNDLKTGVYQNLIMIKKIKETIHESADEMIEFARQLIRIPSITCQEKDLADCVANRMKRLEFANVTVDDMGSVTGVVGNHGKRILFDSHMDTVAVRNPQSWRFDPFGGIISEGKLFGRGTTDMKCALAAAVYAGSAVKKLGNECPNTMIISASVMEEQFEGEALRQICKTDPTKPDFVIICEPTALGLSLGNMGRALIIVETWGIAAHGSSPNLGENAIYKMLPIIQRVEALNRQLADENSESGSIAVTNIESQAESLNSIPAICRIFLDRRLKGGIDRQQVEKEMNRLLKGTDAAWEFHVECGHCYTGKEVIFESVLPGWEIESTHPLTCAGIDTLQDLTGEKPVLFKWKACTNGVASAGELGIPTIGFGPGQIENAHMVDEYCELTDITAAAEFYALLPFYLKDL